MIVKHEKKNDFSAYVLTAFIVCGVIILVTGITIFFYGFHNTDTSVNFLLWRDLFNKHSDTSYLSLENTMDNTTSGVMQVTEIYKLSLAQIQVGLFMSLIGAGVLFFSIGYTFSAKTKRL